MLVVLILATSAFGAPKFGPPTRYAVCSAAGYKPIDVLNADVDGDGDQDLLVVAIYGTSSYYLITMKNNGSGGFSYYTLKSLGNLGYGSFTGPNSEKLMGRPVAVANLNGDTKPDVVAIDITNNRFLVYLNNGSGSFGTGTPYSTTAAPVSIAVAKWGADADWDVLVATRNGNTDVKYFENNGSGVFSCLDTRTVLQSSHYVSEIAVGDLNDDDIDDLAVAIRETNPASPVEDAFAAVIYRNPAGGFCPVVDMDYVEDASIEAIGIKIANVAGGETSLNDIVISTYADVRTYRNDGGATPLVYDANYHLAKQMVYEMAVENWDGSPSWEPDIVCQAPFLSPDGGVLFGSHTGSEWTSVSECRTDGDGHHGIATFDADNDTNHYKDLVVTCYRQEAIAVLRNFRGQTLWVDNILTDNGPTSLGQKVFVYGSGLGTVTDATVGGTTVTDFGRPEGSESLLWFKIPNNLPYGRLSFNLKSSPTTIVYSDPLGFSNILEDPDHESATTRIQGDSNGDGVIDNSDAVNILGWLFYGTGHLHIVMWRQVDAAKVKLD